MFLKHQKVKKNSNSRLEKIRDKLKKLQHKFSKSEIRKIIRKKLYEIENKKSHSALKEIEKYLLGLEKNHSNLKKYYDYDDVEHKGTRDVKDLFDLPIDEDYYNNQRLF